MLQKSKKELMKRIGAAALALSVMGTLAGCGGTDSGTAGGSTADSKQTQSTTSQEGTSAEGSGSGLDYDSIEKPESISWCSHDGLLPENGQEEWDAEFERLTGIKLEHTYVTGNEYIEKIELDYAAGTAPDVFDLSEEHFPKYVAEGALADLTDLVKESGLYDLVDESMWEQCSYNGRIYGVPREFPQACGTYVRKDWLDRLGMEIPTTYEEFITMLTRFRDEIDECLVPYTAPGLMSAQYIPDFYQGGGSRHHPGERRLGRRHAAGKYEDGPSENAGCLCGGAFGYGGHHEHHRNLQRRLGVGNYRRLLLLDGQLGTAAYGKPAEKCP